MAIAGTAYGSHLANTNFSADDAGVEWAGTWEWYTASEGNGGWHFWGTLTDVGHDDGDNVYSKVKVMGYSPNSFYGDKANDGVGDNQEFQNYEVYDPQATTTTHAQYWACRDRNAPLNDNCSDETRDYTR